jgi:hypothetical protein
LLKARTREDFEETFPVATDHIMLGQKEVKWQAKSNLIGGKTLDILQASTYPRLSRRHIGHIMPVGQNGRPRYATQVPIAKKSFFQNFKTS